MLMGNFANTLLYEVPTYLVGSSIKNENRKTKRKKAMGNLKQLLNKYRNSTLINGTIYYNVPENVLDNLEYDNWKHFTDNKFPENDCDIVVFSNKKQKYYIEFTDSEFTQRCINRNYIKWKKL